MAVSRTLSLRASLLSLLRLQHLRDSTVTAAETTGSIVLILLFSFVIGRILVAERIPHDLTGLSREQSDRGACPSHASTGPRSQAQTRWNG